MFLIFSTAQELLNLRTQLEATLKQNEELRQLLNKFHISIPESLSRPASINITVPVETVNSVAPVSSSNTVVEFQNAEAAKTVANSSSQGQLGFSFHSVATIVNSNLQATSIGPTNACTSTPQSFSCVPTVPYMIVNQQQPVGTAAAVCYMSPVTMATAVVSGVSPSINKSKAETVAPVTITRLDLPKIKVPVCEPKNVDKSLSRNGEKVVHPNTTTKIASSKKRKHQTSSNLSNASKVVQVIIPKATQNSNILVTAQNYPIAQPQVLSSSNGETNPLASTKPSKVSRTNAFEPPVTMDICQHEEILSIQNFSVGNLIPSIDGHPSTTVSSLSKQVVTPSRSVAQSNGDECENKAGTSKTTQSRQSPRMAYSIESLTGLSNGEPAHSENHAVLRNQKLSPPLQGQCHPGIALAQRESVVSTVVTLTSSYAQTQAHATQSHTQLQVGTQPRASQTQTQSHVLYTQTQPQTSHAQLQLQPQVVSSHVSIPSLQSPPHATHTQTQPQVTQTQLQAAYSQTRSHAAKTQLQPVAAHTQSHHTQSGFNFSAEALLGSSDEILATSIPTINGSISETPSQTTNTFSASAAGNFQDSASRSSSQHGFSNFSAEALISGSDIMAVRTDSSAGHASHSQENHRNSSLHNHIFTDFSAESLIGPTDLSSGLSSYAIDNLIGRSGASNYNSSAMITVNPNLIHTSVAETTPEHSVNPLRALAALPDMVERMSPVPSSPSSTTAVGSSLYSYSYSSSLTGISQPTVFSFNLNQKNNPSKSTGHPVVAAKPVYSATGSSSSNVLKYSIDNIASSFYTPSGTGSLFSTGGTSSNTVPMMHSFSLDSPSVMPQFSFGLGGPFSPTRTVSGPTTGGFV